MLSLDPKQHQIVTQILASRFPAQKAYFFGSRTTQHTKPWSDLDIALINTPPIDDLTLANARLDFEESDLPFQVDLVLWEELPEAMQRIITQEGIAANYPSALHRTAPAR